jgi:magnesium transporter
MNFTHMPEIEWPWGYPFALGLMAATAVGAIGYFWWKKWF